MSSKSLASSERITRREYEFAKQVGKKVLEENKNASSNHLARKMLNGIEFARVWRGIHKNS